MLHSIQHQKCVQCVQCVADQRECDSWGDILLQGDGGRGDYATALSEPNIRPRFDGISTDTPYTPYSVIIVNHIDQTFISITALFSTAWKIASNPRSAGNSAKIRMQDN